MTEAEARRWCARVGAVVLPYAYHGHTLYIVKLRGFHPGSAERLEWAAESVKMNVDHFLAVGATHGPTGAKLDLLRAA